MGQSSRRLFLLLGLSLVSFPLAVSARSLEHQFGAVENSRATTSQRMLPHTLLDSPQGIFFKTHIHPFVTAAKDTMEAFVAERSARSSDADPFVAEGEFYDSYFRQLREPWTLEDRQASYRRLRMQLADLETGSVTPEGSEFLFHAEKALMMAGYNWGLFSRGEYLKLFDGLRTRFNR